MYERNIAAVVLVIYPSSFENLDLLYAIWAVHYIGIHFLQGCERVTGEAGELNVRCNSISA